jgi:hypothetical protein
MIGKMRTLVLAAAAVTASLATAREAFAWQALEDPFGGSNVACVGRDPADNKTYIQWIIGGSQFHSCAARYEIGDATSLYDDYDVLGLDGNDYLSIGCDFICGRTTIVYEPDIAWGGHYIDLVGGDGNDQLFSQHITGHFDVDSWFFGGPGNDRFVTNNIIGRMIAHGGDDKLRSLSEFASHGWLDGGEGDDCLEQHGGVDYFDCGPGFDNRFGFQLGEQNCEAYAQHCAQF